MTCPYYIVLGDCNSIFVKQYIENVLLNKFQVILLQEGLVSDDYRSFYQENGVYLEPMWYSGNKWLKQVPYIRSSIGAKLWARHIVKKYGRVNCIHVHGLSRNRCNIAQCLRSCSNKLILTVWGSDLLRRSYKQLKSYKKYYESADRITVGTEQMRQALKKAYGDCFLCKCDIVEFSLGILELITEIRHKAIRKDLCLELGFAHPERINVFIGHNGRDCQRHFELTYAMIHLPKEIKDKINLVYTMTYGVPRQPYLANLKQLAEQSGCEFTFIEGYRSEEEVAKIRLVCDILLHAQPTDAASASFYECMYAGAICLNGSWLPYEHIPDYHYRVIEYDAIPQLTSIVQDIIENFQCYKDKFARNVNCRDNNPTPQETAEKWLKIINA